MSDAKLPAVYSMYWNNIADVVRLGQRGVFAHLGIELIQENADQQSHGAWMNEVVARHGPDDVIVFCDIDAFPLKREAYLEAVRQAEQGVVFGLAQFSNHKRHQDLYAGPMFMAFRKRTWEALGRPDLKSNKQYDAAEVLSVLTRQQGGKVELVMPSSCLIPKWALAEHGVFGVATFYGHCDFFHLFESRRPEYERIFASVVDDLVAGRKLNFSHYLAIAQQAGDTPPLARKRNWVPKPLRRYFSSTT